MRSDHRRPDPRNAFVWIWLPDASEAVVAGRLDNHRPYFSFTYGASYLSLPTAIPIYVPELPLGRGPQFPPSGTGLPLCIDDAGPDAWGRRVINYRLASGVTDHSELTYLLESGSNRIGALDFQMSSTEYLARSGSDATLADLVDASARLEAGEPLSPDLEIALMHGSSVGGARPKALLRDGARHLIAKFSSSQDTYPLVQAEYVAMTLARRVGLDVARVDYANVKGRHALLVERFDRGPRDARRHMVSALTMLGLDAYPGGRHATYVDFADQIRLRGSAAQAMAFARYGTRESKLAHCVRAAGRCAEPQWANPTLALSAPNPAISRPNAPTFCRVGCSTCRRRQPGLLLRETSRERGRFTHECAKTPRTVSASRTRVGLATASSGAATASTRRR